MGVYLSLCYAHLPNTPTFYSLVQRKFIKLTLHFGNCIWFYCHVASDFPWDKIVSQGTLLGEGKLIQLPSKGSIVTYQFAFILISKTDIVITDRLDSVLHVIIMQIFPFNIKQRNNYKTSPAYLRNLQTIYGNCRLTLLLYTYI